MPKPLVFEKLTVENFGPFRSRQTIDLPPEGVTIIYGENGHGKTFVTRAFNFALYGHVADRRHSQKQIPFGKLVNLDALKEKEKSSITLLFSCRGKQYRIIREIEPQGDFSNGDSAAVPCKTTCYFYRDGDLIKTGEVDAEINQILPLEISRFFIFDGEQMQEYRDLLDDKGTQQRIISQSIERILGVPYLKSAERDTKKLAEYWSREIGRMQQDHYEIGEIQKALSSINGEIEEFGKQKAEWEQKKSEAEESVEATKARLNAFDKIQAILNDIQRIDGEFKSLETRLGENKNKRISLANEVWKAILGDYLMPEVVKLETKEKQFFRKNLQLVRRKTIESSILKKRCDICNRPLPPDLLDRLQEELVSFSDGNEESTEILSAFNKIQNQIKLFKGLAEKVSVLDEIRTLNTQAETTRIEMERLKIEKEIAKEKIGGDDKEVKVQELARRLASEEKRLDNADYTLNKVNGDIQEKQGLQKDLIDRIKSLRKSNGSETPLDLYIKRQQQYSDLQTIFDQAIGRFRENLKNQVENTSSELFICMISDESVKGLRINDSFGLEMVRWDGPIIPLPSDGQFHITSLALIGALHKNAPLEGPLVMDAPVIRLDEVHVDRLFSALPDLSDQVILLATPRDLPEETVIRGFGDKLRKEYRIERIVGDSENRKGCSKIVPVV